MNKAVKAGLILLFLAAVCFTILHLPLEVNARRRVDKFVEQVNYGYKEPEKIYVYLTEDYRKSITKEDFVTAFKKERTYPYLTPFFINFLSMEMEEGNMRGVAHYSQAARLGGTYYDITVVYENFNYYMIMDKYNGFPDGSYLKKFDKIPSYLINGWLES